MSVAVLRTTGPEPIVEARNLPKADVHLTADVVVVGSGAGGAVVATECAEAGLDVLVLEEGGHIRPDVYAKFNASQSLRHMGREGGTTAAMPIGDTPLISILAGRTVGGSSTMTGGVCFRVPESISDSWVKTLGLEDYSAAKMEPFYERVEKSMRVTEVPVEMWSRSTVLFAEGAAKRGIDVHPMRRNAPDCKGWSKCNFGCPEQAKLSVDLSYLPRARAHGARVWADCKVDRVITRGDRAAGVEGRLLNGRAGKPGSRFRVDARAVVIAAGSLHTPLVLARSGVGRHRGVLGRNLTLHPSFRIAAMFDEEVRGWDGAMQSAYSDTFEADGITLNGVYAPLNILAAALPGVGREWIDRVRGLGHLAAFGGMVHDEGGGRIWGEINGEPIITYKLAPRDKQRMIRGTKLLAEAFFDAGAKEVMLPRFGVGPMKSPDELKTLDEYFSAKRFECVAFHPLGTARMAQHEKAGVVQPSGETWDLPGLWVADGSIFPTSIGVNSQLPIMAMATRIATNLLQAWRR